MTSSRSVGNRAGAAASPWRSIVANGVPLEFDEEEFARRWKRGDSINEMATWLDCSPAVVDEQRNSLGLESRKAAAYEVDIDKLRQLWKTSLSRVEICCRLNIRQEHLSRLVTKHRLPPRGLTEKPTGKPKIDPFVMTADEYERRKAEVRAMHMARRRLERYEPKDI